MFRYLTIHQRYIVDFQFKNIPLGAVTTGRQERQPVDHEGQRSSEVQSSEVIVGLEWKVERVTRVG